MLKILIWTCLDCNLNIYKIRRKVYVCPLPIIHQLSFRVSYYQKQNIKSISFKSVVRVCEVLIILTWSDFPFKDYPLLPCWLNKLGFGCRARLGLIGPGFTRPANTWLSISISCYGYSVLYHFIISYLSKY